MSTDKPKKGIFNVGWKKKFIVGDKKMSLDPRMVEREIAKALEAEESEHQEKIRRAQARYATCPIFEPDPDAPSQLALVDPAARVRDTVLMEFEDTATGKKVYLHKSIVDKYFRRVKPGV